MTLIFQIDFDLNSTKFKNFLTKSSIDTFLQIMDTPLGYVFEDSPKNIRLSDKSDNETIDFDHTVLELWKMYQNKKLIGTHEATIVRMQELNVSTKYNLMFAENLSAEAKSLAQNILRSFNPRSDEPKDVEKEIEEEIKGSILKTDDFILMVQTVIVKVGDFREIDVSQRKTIFDLYNEDSGNVNGQIDIVDGSTEDNNTREWSRNRKITWKLVGVRPTDNDGETEDDFTHWWPEGENTPNIEPAVDRILRDVIPSDCGQMKYYEHRLLTVLAWPEFKIKWVVKSIKIGCARVKTKLPQLYRCTTKMIAYVYYKLPTNIASFAVRIASVCAVRTALKSAIIGIIVSNPVAAAASFVPWFKQCIADEIEDCIHPGLLLAKKRGSWQRI
ncbi:MAG: hypothetical protein COA43_14125 [Robiginitomaculum sp.]|nr:MAG: hypothetical protein COA43_14125 [Robiginitomaculum sp.]